MSNIIVIRHKGNFKNSYKILHNILRIDYKTILDRYGRQGVALLSEATPTASGETAQSWGYTIEEGAGSISIVFTNTHVNKDVNIAIILQYGHGTGTGGYVQGRDYINPAIQPVFDEMANTVWKELIR